MSVSLPPDPDLEAVEATITRLAELGITEQALHPVRDWLRDRRAGIPEHAWFFGCKNGPGHHLWLPNLRTADYDVPPACRYGIGPFKRIDGYLTPTETTKQSAAAIHHADGWTALAMHDYSADSRPGSNANFVFDSDISWDMAIEQARAFFPGIVARIEAVAPISGPHEYDLKQKEARRG